MTHEELAAIITGIAPIVRQLRDAATEWSDALALEISTVRDALLTQGRAAEVRHATLETRCRALEQLLEGRMLELEASAAAVRS